MRHRQYLPWLRELGRWTWVRDVEDWRPRGRSAQSIFRSLVPLRLPLGEVVQHANRLFTDSTLPSSHATLVAGRLDRSGMLEICNAGHCPALLVRNGKVTRLGGSGFPLGFFSSSTFE